MAILLIHRASNTVFLVPFGLAVKIPHSTHQYRSNISIKIIALT